MAVYNPCQQAQSGFTPCNGRRLRLHGADKGIKHGGRNHPWHSTIMSASNLAKNDGGAKE
jgi:hypothetical protein